MLTWETARGRAKLGERVRLDRGVVENAAGLAELLSSRTDSVKAAAATDERLARVVEAVFRALTDVGARKFAVRRPCAFRDLCAIAGTTPEEVRAVVDVFRAPRVSFLKRYPPTPIVEKTQIDISDGALIRCWRTLGGGNGWLKKEFRDGIIWRTLLDQAENIGDDKLSLLSEAATEVRADRLRLKLSAGPGFAIGFCL